MAIPFGSVFVYLPVVAVPYAFLDDYPQLAWQHGYPGDSLRFGALGGRPLSGALNGAAFDLIGDIDGLRFARLLSIIGIALLGLLLYRALVVAGLRRWLAVAIALFVITMPPFQVYAAWAVLWSVPYGAVLAGLASLSVGSAFRSAPRSAVFRLSLGVPLLLAALLIYQPAAMFFWVFAAIQLVRSAGAPRTTARLAGAHVLVAAVALGFAFASLKLATHHYGAAGAKRTALTDDVPGKITWFVRQPLYDALNFSNLAPPRSFALTVVLCVAVAIGTALALHLLHRRGAWHGLVAVGVAAALLPLAYLPNLLVAENWPSYRSQAALSAQVSLYAWLVVWSLARLIAERLRTRPAFLLLATRLAPLAAVAVVGASGMLAARNVTTLFVEPQSLELDFMRDRLGQGGGTVRRVVMIRPDWWQGSAPLVRGDEFGLPSTYARWVPHAAVFLILRESGRLGRPLTVEQLAPDTAIVPSKSRRDEAVVDMRELMHHPVPWSLWTLRPATS